MRTKLAYMAAGALLMAMVAGGITIASASSKAGGTTTIKVTSKTTDFRGIDEGPQGGGIGDEFVVRKSLSQNGKWVGQEQMTCEAVFGGRAMCTAGFKFAKRGQIVTTAVVNLFPRVAQYNVPITGGSGEFKGARGQVLVTNPTKNTSELTFTLLT